MRKQEIFIAIVVMIFIISMGCAVNPQQQQEIAQTITSTDDVATQTTAPTPTPLPAPVAPAIRGIHARGISLADKLLWLDRNVDSHNTYIVDVNADEIIAPYTFLYRGAVDITIVFRGYTQDRTIGLDSNDTMFTIGENVTLILDNNITLQGHKRDKGAMIKVNPSGTLIMNAETAIIGNTISAENEGSGVHINGGTFTMNGGSISGNTAINGGGVYIDMGGVFTMLGGNITKNTAKNGAGVYINQGTFTMQGGTILANVAHEYGGGVSTNYNHGSYMIDFTKSGGIITGYSSDKITGNVVMDEEGNILARKGHAVFRREDMRKETTSGAVNRMSIHIEGIAGGWEQ